MFLSNINYTLSLKNIRVKTESFFKQEFAWK
jgi:hypothetical protein